MSSSPNDDDVGINNKKGKQAKAKLKKLFNKSSSSSEAAAEQQVGLLSSSGDSGESGVATSADVSPHPSSATIMNRDRSESDRLNLNTERKHQSNDDIHLPRTSPAGSSVPFTLYKSPTNASSGSSTSTSASSSAASSPRRKPAVTPISHAVAHPHHSHNDLIDTHHPLPASSPPAFIRFESPPRSPSNGSGNRLENHSQTSIWRRRIAEMFSTATWYYYLRHALHEMRRRKCNHALGLFSCFLVVTVAAVCYTLIDRASVIFLQQAEANVGQSDLILEGNFGIKASYLNYSTVRENLELVSSQDRDYSFHTSRTLLNVQVLPYELCNSDVPVGVVDGDTDWMYIGNSTLDGVTAMTPAPQPASSSSSPCLNSSRSCLESVCSFPSYTSEYIPLWLISTQQESDMSFGRKWPFSKLSPGEAVVTIDLSNSWNVGPDDIVMVKVDLSGILKGMIALGVQWKQAEDIIIGQPTMNTNLTTILDSYLQYYSSITYLPFRIRSVIRKTYGKFTTDQAPMMIIEQDGFLEYVMKFAHPTLRNSVDVGGMVGLLKQTGKNVTALEKELQHANMRTMPHSLLTYPTYYPDQLLTMKSYADQIIFNLNPKKRINIYMNTNYDELQSSIIEWSSRIIYFTGFTQVDSSIPILQEMNKVKMFSLYLGLILSIILTILFLLSILLIYSLLMISIESRTFELGVHRMCGMNRWNIVKLLVIQALSFSIPAWVIGLVSSQIIIAIVLGRLEASVEIPLDKLLTRKSIAVGSIMGLILPLISSILPIRSALSHNLQDALDTRHSKTVGVKFSIERSADSGINAAWMALGVTMTMLGGAIYYLVPLALLSFNLTLFFNIFFALLLGMLLGLIVLSLNFQPVLERFIVFLFLWWENGTSKFVVLKNLVTHRVRNRKTSVMFALSLGFILFITMAFQLELYSAKARLYKSYGAELVVYPRFINQMGLLRKDAIAQMETLLNDHSSIISQYSWITPVMKWAGGEWDDTWISNIGHVYTNDVEVYGVTSNVFDTTFNEYLIYDSDTPSISQTSLSEQIYTATASQSAIMGTSMKKQFGLHNTDGEKNSFLYALQARASSTSPAALQFHRMRSYTFLDNAPKFALGRFPSIRPQPTIVSLPTYMRLSNNYYTRLEDIPMSHCLIQFRSGVKRSDKNAFIAQINDYAKQHTFQYWDIRTVATQLEESNKIMSFIFSIATYIAMFLCLFSLIASMLTNIIEQSKEISILRSIGLTKFKVIKIYTEEAFVLVMSSSILGIAIGFIMSATLIAQRILFTQLPVPFAQLFPWSILIYTFTGSVICAFIASVIPARKLMEKSIASIMKSVL